MTSRFLKVNTAFSWTRTQPRRFSVGANQRDVTRNTVTTECNCAIDPSARILLRPAVPDAMIRLNTAWTAKMEPEGEGPLAIVLASGDQQDTGKTDSADASEDEGIFVPAKPDTTADNQEEEETESKRNDGVEVDDKALEDEESETKSMTIVSDDDSDVDAKNIITSSRRRKAILSDDEDSNPLPSHPVNKGFLSSDEEQEEEKDLDKKSKSSKTKRIVQRIGSDSDDSESEIFPRNASDQPPVAIKPYKYNSDLFDAELTDEDEPRAKVGESFSPTRPQYSDDENERSAATSKKKKKKGPSLKERQQDVMDIHSETQRMVRDSQISLPYHRPKQRTLAEFLERRKKVAPVLSLKRGSLKMSMRDMATLKMLEEKKKEVEDFYKSDSDQEDPEDRDWTPGNNPDGDQADQDKEMDKEMETQLPSQADDNEDLPDLSQNIGAPEEGKTDNVEEQQSSMHVDKETHPDVGGIVGESTKKNVDDSGIQSGTSSSAEDSQPDQDVVMEDITAGAKEDVVTSVVKESGDTQDDFEIEEYLPKATTEEKDSPQIISSDPKSPQNSDAKSGKKIETPKLNLLAAKLPDLDLNKITKTTPKLSLGKDCDFIDLDEEPTVTPKNPGLNELMNRFVRHSNTKRKPSDKQQVNLSVVSKEKGEDGSEKLVASNIIVNLDAEDDDMPIETVPGARHTSLKTALQAKIREQRERERVRRVKERQFIESEQVIEDYQDNGAFLDEEKEFTDESETDCESEPEENDIIIKDKKRKKNKYLDEEAEDEDEEMQEDDEDSADEEGDDDDDDDDGGNQEAEDGDSNDTVELPSTRKRIIMEDKDEDNEDGDHLKLQWEESQDVNAQVKSKSLIEGLTRTNTEDLFASQSKKMDSVDKDASITSMDSSFEFFGSVIPGHQPGGGLRRSGEGIANENDGETAFLTPLTKTKSGSFNSVGRDRDLSLPIENSQDLFISSAPHSAPGSPSTEGPSLHLTPMEDSQFGPHETRKEPNPMAKLKLDFTGIEGSQDGDELIGLCSGQFTGKETSSKVDQLCEEEFAPTQDINSLMGLCSGTFDMQDKDRPTAFASLTESQDKKNEDEEDELLGLCTGKFSHGKCKEVYR
ncbi:claspin-like isoform X1 [Penaeus chinensis]|uniref:claspin-like isoform X1 n=2 Tax=Penaeus chinensis TaxID=139456 RepID=UPI001FB68C26|nr:claspin-like isoform X1 [Penaeus chinensis]